LAGTRPRFLPVVRPDATWLGPRITATRVKPGAIGLSSQSHFTLMLFPDTANPVALPPGRARLAAKPPATGSETDTNTIGTVLVVRCNSDMMVLPWARITSGPRAINSLAYWRIRS